VIPANEVETSPPKVLRPPRGPRVREVVQEAARECALQPANDDVDLVYHEKYEGDRCLLIVEVRRGS